jgi:hypothetical protein
MLKKREAKIKGAFSQEETCKVKPEHAKFQDHYVYWKSISGDHLPEHVWYHHLKPMGEDFVSKRYDLFLLRHHRANGKPF